ncbi:MAG: multifunctional CCA addition/repair protein [Acidiferrobacterales bacterium]
MRVYLVGGAVRDRLLGMDATDRDYVVVGATPEEMIARGFKPVGADFPVFLHPQTKEQYALARTERKTGAGYRGFTVHASPDVTLEDDLRRRDLTINAMAQAEDGALIDPFGGAEDLRNGLLRHVSPAFAEDPVRILRVARFAARYAKWGFHIAHSTNALMKHMAENGEVDALVAERVWVEMERALAEDRPSVFFQVLRGCGALERLFPEIAALFGVPQPAHQHPEVDTGKHALKVLDQAALLSKDTRVRFAALLHDIGKSRTPKQQWPGHAGHEGAGAELIRQLCNRLRAPKDYRDLAILVAQYHGRCHHAAELTAADLLDVLELIDAFRRPERVDQFLVACEADARGRCGFENEPYPQADRVRRAFAAARAVDGAGAVQAGVSGPAAGEWIRRERLAAISRIAR